MAAHTPGPWTLLPDRTFSELGDKRIIGANKISPGIVFGGLGAETEANARLIAAAPALLEIARQAAMLTTVVGTDAWGLKTVAAALLATLDGGGQ